MKTPSKKPRQRAPEWMIWEEFVSDLQPWNQQTIEEHALEYLDHTDKILVLICRKPFDRFAGDPYEVISKDQAGSLRCEIVGDGTSGFLQVSFIRIEEEWVLDSGFYHGRKWRTCRYATLLQQGNWCRCCGRRPPDVELHVDHIEPRSLAPERAWDLSNLQVLCRDCNLGKGNGDVVDWRGAKALTT